MSKEFVFNDEDMFGRYCFIEQKRYGIPNEKFLYKIIGRLKSNAYSDVPVDANNRDMYIHKGETVDVVNVICCGVSEEKVERYRLQDIELTNKFGKDQKIAELETQLCEALAKLKTKEYAPVFCSLADKECEYLGKVKGLEKALEELENAKNEN